MNDDKQIRNRNCIYKVSVLRDLNPAVGSKEPRFQLRMKYHVNLSPDSDGDFSE